MGSALGKGQLKGAGDKPVSPEHMELARRRAENARLRTDATFWEKLRGTLPSCHRELRLDCKVQVPTGWSRRIARCCRNLHLIDHFVLRVDVDVLGRIVVTNGLFEDGGQYWRTM